MRGQFSVRYFILSMMLAAAVTVFCGETRICCGQQQYSPAHPEVEAMVRKAVGYLNKKTIPNGSGERVLAALTIVETSKRYDNIVPVENVYVQDGIASILKDLDSGRFERNHEIYYPALALILLCDVGDDKYRDEINEIIRIIVDRQEKPGGYAYRTQRGSGHGDTSQTQYAALALWVAYKHGFAMPIETPGKMLDWFLDVNQANGSWYYTYDVNGRFVDNNTFFLSIHAASIGTVYLLADFLQAVPKSTRRSPANKRKKLAAETSSIDTPSGLPPSVTDYVPPREGEGFSPINAAGGPLYKVDSGKLSSVKRSANQFLEKNFAISIDRFGYYYLYALERYAFFREKAEGSVKGIPDWYDQGVTLLKSREESEGGFKKGREGELNKFIGTCFAVLFLVRSSEILIPPSGEGNLNGSVGLPANVRLDIVDGKVKSFDVIKGLDDVLKLLEGDELDEQQFELVQDSLTKSIAQLSQNDERSEREQLSYMRGFVSNRNYFKRLIAIRLLARQQDMDNVPALLYALGDPDLRICNEAHNGLRLISRKLDSIQLPENPGHGDYQSVKREWTQWFLQIRPGAELLD